MTRRQLDDYPTPAWAVEAIVPELRARGGLTAEATILEPACGAGAILTVLRNAGARAFWGLDINPEAAAEATARGFTAFVGDFLTTDLGERPDVIVMNPPFGQAQAFVERALEVVKPRGLVVALLRLAFAEGQKRAPFHRAWPADLYVLPRRPSFTADGRTDSAAYAWWIWCRAGRRTSGTWQVLDCGGPR